jgi:hypothetical protein
MKTNDTFFLSCVMAVMMCCMPKIAYAADKKSESEDKIVSALLQTPQSVLPPELSSEIAKFAVPGQDGQFPIDFIVGATIIPWDGKVYDIRRDKVTKCIKVLMGRFDKSSGSIFIGNLNTMDIEEEVNIPLPQSSVRDIYFSAHPGIIEIRWNRGIFGEDRFAPIKKGDNNDYFVIEPESFENNGLKVASHMMLRQARSRKRFAHNKNILWRNHSLTVPRTNNFDVCSKWLDTAIAHISPGSTEQNVYDIEMMRRFLGLQVSKRGVELHQRRNAMELDQIAIKSSMPLHVDPFDDFFVSDITYTLATRRSITLPSCCSEATTFAPLKTKCSSCVVLNTNGKYVCVDLRVRCSAQLQMLLHNIIRERSLEHYQSKNSTYSLNIVPERRRKKIIENLRVFCGVKGQLKQSIT